MGAKNGLQGKITFPRSMKNSADIKYLFEPRSIAIIGASHKPEKIGYQIFRNILNGGYSGKIFPVNPSGGTIAKHKVLKSIDDIPEPVDTALIVIPEKLVFEEVKRCGEKKVKHLVIITSGFSEVGNIAGENQLIDIAKSFGMRVLGPNIFGIYCAKSHLNATFGPSDISSGNTAIITQSGAIGIAMIGKTKAEKIGLSAIISVGNKADIDEADLLEYLCEDKLTKSILLYIEGIKGKERLVNSLKNASLKKPVIAIKSGRSKRGAMAAASHTGSLAGADEVFDNIARQCGIIRAESIQEALDWCKYLSHAPVPSGKHAVIITNGGGIGVLAADACEKYNVPLFDDAKKLREIYSNVIPAFGSTKNPIDLTGQAGEEQYVKALNQSLNDKDISSVICLGCETASLNAQKFSKVSRLAYKSFANKKPIVFSIFGGVESEKQMCCLRMSGLPIFPDVYQAVSCLGALYSHHKNLTRPKLEKETGALMDINRIDAVIKKVKNAGRSFLLSNEAQDLMKEALIPMPKSFVAKSISSAVKFWESIGSSVALKVVSKDIVHKSDVGGVVLDLENENEIVNGYESIMHNCRAYSPDAKIEGIEVVEMVRPGVETIVGARRDPSFGTVVMFGLGGIYVEVMKDVSFRAYPLSLSEIRSMIQEIRSYPLLLGVRGENKKDIEAIVETITKVGKILSSCPEITDIEINPLVVYDEGEGAKAVDARILLAK